MRHRPRVIFRTTCCANCTASFTCSKIRRSSWRVTSCVRPSRILTGSRRPFFRALTHYAQDGSYSWHCPGHSGGVAFLKSPVGHMFHQFFGRGTCCAPMCATRWMILGQLLDHSGPVAASERNAARIFGCDHLFFVTNGTSTSNKIVWHSTVAPGDVVIVDRQLPRVHSARDYHDGRDPGVPDAHAKSLRDHRADPARRIQVGKHREKDRGASVCQQSPRPSRAC